MQKEFVKILNPAIYLYDKLPADEYVDYACSIAVRSSDKGFVCNGLLVLTNKYIWIYVNDYLYKFDFGEINVSWQGLLPKFTIFEFLTANLNCASLRVTGSQFVINLSADNFSLDFVPVDGDLTSYFINVKKSKYSSLNKLPNSVSPSIMPIYKAWAVALVLNSISDIGKITPDLRDILSGPYSIVFDKMTFVVLPILIIFYILTRLLIAKIGNSFVFFGWDILFYISLIFVVYKISVNVYWKMKEFKVVFNQYLRKSGQNIFFNKKDSSGLTQ